MRVKTTLSGKRLPGYFIGFIAGAFLLLLVNPSLALSQYAQTKQLNLEVKKVTLKEALKKIEEQSAFTFAYNDAKIDVDQLVTLRVSNVTIDDLLLKIFEGTAIEYKVVNKKIVLKPKSKGRTEGYLTKPLQDKLVRGEVTDAKTGETLPGVNIRIQGTNQGTTTDVQGKYKISLPSDLEEPVLIFSFVGYLREQVPVNGRSEINVVLQPKIRKLDEVVVIGYGESSRKLLTSSISSIRSEDIENTISNGVQEVLQGKTSGVTVNRNSGTPGAAPTMSIRGISSISAGTQPLYVVDGIPVTSGDYSQISMEGQNISAIADLNPDNIKSVSVLKDASAAAIYGARAGNGVILIETKSGQSGETRYNFKAYNGMQEVYKKLDVLNAAEWKEYVVNFPGVSDDYSGIHPNLEQQWFTEGVNTNWLDKVLRAAPIQNYQLSASGGKKGMRFYVSGRYFKQKGVVIGTDYDKYNGRINVDYDLADNLKIGAKITTTYSLNDRVRGDQTVNGPLPNAISAPPVAPVRDSLGNYPLAGWWDNPVAIGREVINQAETFHNISNIYGEYRITDNLKVKNQWGFDYYNLQERRFEPSFVKSAKESNGYGADGSSNVFKLTQQTTLNYIKEIGEKHKINALLGYSFEKWDGKYLFMAGTQFPNDQLQYLESAAVIDEEATQSAFSESGLTSFFGRLKYNYGNKYLVNLTLRRDGSSNFGDNYRYAYLPAVSFAWRAIEEPFLKNQSLLSDLKFKFSYGLTGNDDIGAFGSLNLYSSGYNYYGQSGLIPTQIPNPDLKWETTSNYNAGLDIGLFNNRVLLSANYYYNHTTDLLLARPVPLSSGFGSMDANVGELENRGMEFELSTENVQGTFNWTTDFNISFNRNKVLELYNDQPLTPGTRGNNAVIVGEPIGIFYMYESLGVDPSTGELMLEDVNNDGAINEKDRQIVGSPQPDFTGGMTNNMSYKNLDLSFFVQFVSGNDLFNGVRQYAENMTITNDNQLSTIKDRWQEPGDQTYVPKLNGKYNNTITSHYLEEGSFLRLKNVTLSYNLPIDKLGANNLIRSARIYLRGENLITVTPYSGMDPEVNYSGVSTISRGVDFFTYPQVRSYTVGLNLKF